MARPQHTHDWRDFHDGSGDDWEALRADLVSLLDQVDQEIPGHADTRVSSTSPDDADSYVPRRRNLAHRPAPARQERPQDNPQAVLQAAIEDIRARTQDMRSVRRSAPSERMRAPERQSAWGKTEPDEGYGREIRDHIAGINKAVMTLSDRLVHVEEQIQDQRTSGTELGVVAQQVEQLVGVVEMLAGAVGETGQVKRLEGQINRLAELVTKGNKSEIGSLTKRIDDVAATVDKLADMQADQIERAKSEPVAQGPDSSELMHTMEEGVRGIYDRIDMLEKRYALSANEVERLTSEMSEFSQIVRTLQNNDDASPAVLERLDVLTQHLAQMEQSSGNSDAMREIRGDVTALRSTLSDAFEKRFNDLEDQIGSLSSKLASGNDIDVSTLEAQITQLAKRMEQTGDKIDDLQRTGTPSAGATAEPDFEKLATMVANRTSEEFARRHGGGLSEDSIAAIEARLSRMFEAREPEQAPERIDEVRKDIKQVDARLGRLEAALTQRMRSKPSAPAKPAAEASAAAAPAQTEKQSAKPEVTAAVSQIRAKAEQQSKAAKSDDVWAELDDLMPRSPAKDAPLQDKSFGEAPLELPSALRADEEPNSKQSPKKPAQSQAEAHGAAPQLDPEQIDRPAKPKSRFSDDPPEGFRSAAAQQAPEQRRPTSPLPGMSGERAPTADRNTFIAAARRAAMRQAEEQVSEEENSLIGRAFARLNKRSSAPEEPKFEEPEAPVVIDEEHGRHSYELDDDEAHEEAPKGSFLSRYRRPLLLAVALVIVCLLTINLIAQRMSPSPQADQPAITEAPETPAEDVGPETDSVTAPSTPPASLEGRAEPAADAARMIETDPTSTSSIDPMVSMNLTDPAPVYQSIPMALTNSAQTGSLSSFETGSVSPSAEISGAVQVELPPENVGSLALRQAAADGDARAQFEIGAIYSEGQIVEKDFDASSIWYERSAAQGFAPAQYRLGTLYEHGRGVEKDLQQARLWYQRSADAGNRMAMHNLAALYASGDLGKQDFEAAADWFGRAAERGMVDSQFNLGMLYARGLGVPQDLAESYKWFGLAADKGDEDALKARDDIGRSLDADAIAGAQSEIDNWTITPLDIAANFAPIGAWSADFDPGSPIKDREVVQKVQAALTKLGYDVGEPDGLLGPKTREAIKTFERSAGMSEVGLVNPRLLAVLGSQPV